MSSADGPNNDGRMTGNANEAGALQRAIAALEKMKARLDATERAAYEPIAIIGLSCRFPGGGEGSEAFWQVLSNGIDAVREIPESRWPANEIPGEHSAARWAALLDDFSQFDAAFFGISPREAETLDPQQRALLELTWEALEDAALPPDRLIGSRTGVFLGICSSDYQILVGESRTGNFDAYCATGSMFSTAAGRVAYSFGFQGPTMSIDTACSSSLVAIAQAAQNLRTGDCDVAIAGGVNAVLSSRTMALLLATQALSPDGRCKTLDARANGFVRGEGCGLLVLKRLSDALQHGDRIRGIIRGWAVNQDGRSTGLTTPNVLSQQAMLRQALQRARLSPADIGYVEMHGTGTSLGDPIEAEALREVLGAPRADGSRCALGSVKTNIGHLEGAAGIAGLIKILLAFEHELIPRNLHFRRLNPRISFDGTPFVIPQQHLPWPRDAKPRRAGVSSFGLSGTNAHIIVEEGPAIQAPTASASHAVQLIPLSAKTPAGLRDSATAMKHWITSSPELALNDIAYTAGARRTHHEYRFVATTETKDELTAQLDGFLRGQKPASTALGRANSSNASRVTFVFSGQGSQWPTMGRGCMEEPRFRAKVEEIDAIVQSLAGFSIITELLAPEGSSRLDETEFAQPAIFCMQIGLVEYFRGFGIVPQAVIGHSVGEVAAAHVSGAISLEQAIKLVLLRGRIMQRATGNGKMAWVGLPADRINQFLRDQEESLAIAAINDPSSVVLSGKTTALEEVITQLNAAGVATRPVRVNYAFHSPQMDSLAQLFVEKVGEIQTTPTSVPMYSTVYGKQVDGKTLNAAYWGKNMRACVNLAEAVLAAASDGSNVYLEISPHAVLTANLEQCLMTSDGPAVVIPTLQRQRNERRTLMETLAALHVQGSELNWNELYRDKGRIVPLPKYPWQRERFWIELPRQTRTNMGQNVHPLLGIRIDSSIARSEHLWQQWLSLAAFPYLSGHVVLGRIVFPGAGYMEMIRAAASVLGSGVVVIDEMSLEEMMPLTADIECELQTVLQIDDRGDAGVAIATRNATNSEWTRLVGARCGLRDFGHSQHESTATIEMRCLKRIDANTHYANMDARGLVYSSAFRAVREIRLGENEVLGTVALPDAFHSQAQQYGIHPGLLDACLQVATWALHERVGSGTLLPKGLLGARFYEKFAHEGTVHARYLGDAEDGTASIGISLRNHAGRVCVEIDEIRVAHIGSPVVQPHDPQDQLLLNLTWKKKTSTLAAPPNASGAWLIFEDGQGLGHALATQLRECGHDCIEVRRGDVYSRQSINVFILDRTDPKHLRSLFDDAFGNHRSCQGIVHLVGLDSTPWSTTTADKLSTDLRQSCSSALGIVQRVLTQGWRDLPRLVFVTRGVYAIEPSDTIISPAQAPLWGLGRTIALEHPTLECIRIDLSATTTTDEANTLFRELVTSDGEDQIALRASGRYVARLTRTSIAAAAARDFEIRPNRTYLITGGLGGLGLELAKWLIDEGAHNLLLIGRNAPTPDIAAAIEDMQKRGAKIVVGRADVAQGQSLADLLETQRHGLPPLAGIVHAAATLQDRTVLEMTEDAFMQVLDAKIMGAFHLHRLTVDEELDFFVLYSSAASVLGSPGQANYAAANAFLDAFARARAARNLPTTSIAWGPFTHVGLAAAVKNRGARLSVRGIEGISPAEGHELLRKLLHHPRAEVAAIRLSVRQWQEFFPQVANLPMLAELRNDEADATTSDVTFRRQLEAEHPTKRSLRLQTHLLEHLGRVLHIDPSRIDPAATFANLGIDSLMSLELRNRLQATLGMELAATLLFTYPTIEKLIAYLMKKLDLPTSSIENTATQTDPNEKTPVEHSVTDVDVDDLMAMLDEELAATNKGRSP